jgi:hypothetical protein
MINKIFEKQFNMNSFLEKNQKFKKAKNKEKEEMLTNMNHALKKYLLNALFCIVMV